VISFVIIQNFWPYIKYLTKKNIRKRNKEGRKPKKNRKHNEQAPPLYKIALGHAPSQKTITRELLWLARASAKI